MNRMIKFRGKPIVIKDDWIYGNYILDGRHHYIAINVQTQTDEHGTGSWLVHEETVGQFTGLHDKNGVEIYEGDIIAYCGKEFLTAIVCYGGYNANGENCAMSNNYGWYFDVIQCQRYTNYKMNKPLHCISGKASFYPKYCGGEIVEVIGNIHDHPELIKMP